MAQLGRLNKVEDLREIWPHEANDFTKWLVCEENLELLSDAIGIAITFEDRESPVGDFNVDIYAKEVETGKNIIIENQLEDTDHAHLGKLITYASGKDASYVIWIVKHAREEHRNAIDWLNNHTLEGMDFFLLEIELWKVDDSLPAPKFNIVARPNNWAKEIRQSDAALSDTRAIQLLFWEKFKSYALQNKAFTETFSLRTPRPSHWYDISIGTSQAHISLTIDVRKQKINAGIYISNNKSLYEQFYEHRKEIEDLLMTEVKWHTGAKDARFYISKEGNISKSEEDWEEYFAWLCAQTLDLHSIFNKFK